jgi:hypothetical protein
VKDGNAVKNYRSWQKDVKNFLAEAKIELGENDRIEPGLESAMILSAKSDVKINITRVAITEVKIKEKIDIKIITREDPELPRGQKKVTKGELGERTKVFRLTRENGVEVKREQLKNEITKQPKDGLVIIGTKLVYGEVYTGKASWYKYNSTKVATDHFKRGTWLEITNLTNGKKITVKNDGCICAETGYVVDLHPDHFTALGGKITAGVIKSATITEIKNYEP